MLNEKNLSLNSMFNFNVLVSISLCSVLGLLIRCVRLFGTCNKIPERSGLNEERFIGTHCFGQWSCGSTSLKRSGSVEILTEGRKESLHSAPYRQEAGRIQREARLKLYLQRQAPRDPLPPSRPHLPQFHAFSGLH